MFSLIFRRFHTRANLCDDSSARCLCTCCVRQAYTHSTIYLHPITHHIHTDHFISLSIFASFFRFRNTHTHTHTVQCVCLFSSLLLLFRPSIYNILFLRSFRCRYRRRPLRGLLFVVCSRFVFSSKIFIDAMRCYCNRTHGIHTNCAIAMQCDAFVQRCWCLYNHGIAIRCIFRAHIPCVAARNINNNTKRMIHTNANRNQIAIDAHHVCSVFGAL